MFKVQKIIVFYQVKVLVVDGFSRLTYRSDKDLQNYLMRLLMTKEMKHSVGTMKMLRQQPQLNWPIACYYTDNGSKTRRHRQVDYKQVLQSKNHLIFLLNMDREK